MFNFTWVTKILQQYGFSPNQGAENPTDGPQPVPVSFTARILAYMKQKGMRVATNPKEVNIIYIEGCDSEGYPNKDELDGWNDRRIVIVFDQNGNPSMILNAAATTEPGLASTMDPAAKQRGGVARIGFGQFKAWSMGFHKWDPGHPALRQVRDITITRDLNQDGIRPGDKTYTGQFYIHQHGTREDYDGTRVGFWSAGCLVGKTWSLHEFFIGLCLSDPRYKANPEYVFDTTIIDGDDLAKVCPIEPVV